MEGGRKEELGVSLAGLLQTVWVVSRRNED